jgi:DNA-binding LacI/PurR family transcriptional regulator
MSQSAPALSLPAYKAIKHRLGRVISEKWRAGSRLPPIQELSRQIGAGQKNTLRAVQEFVAEGGLASRPGAGTFVTESFDFLVYGVESHRDDLPTMLKPPPTESLVGKRIVMLGVDGVDAFMMRIASRISDELVARGAGVSRIAQAEHPEELISRLNRSRQDLVVMFQPTDGTLSGLRADLPVVLISTSDAPLVSARRVDLVTVDQRQGGVLAGQRLRQAGSRLPCFMGVVAGWDETGGWDGPSAQRLRGFELGFGHEVRAEHVLRSPFYDPAEGARLAGVFVRMNPRPDCIFCASDELAIGFLQGALAFNLEPGEDYRLIGFDGQERGKRVGEGPLTTVAIPAADMGRHGSELAVRRLLDPDRAPQRVFLGCSLLEGQTVELSPRRRKVRDAMRKQRRLLHPSQGSAQPGDHPAAGFSLEH